MVFGQKPRCGISNLPCDRDFLEKLATEDDLKNAFGDKVFDDYFERSDASNKPSDDLTPSKVAPNVSAFQSIVVASPDVPDLTPAVEYKDDDDDVPPLNVWAGFDTEDFQVKSDDASDESWEERLASEAEANEWEWLEHCDKPPYSTNEKRVFVFPGTSSRIQGQRYPAYASDQGVEMDRAMFFLRVGKNAWARLGYNGKPHRKFLSDRESPLTDAGLKMAIARKELLMPHNGLVTVVRGAYERIKGYGMKPVSVNQDAKTESNDSSSEDESLQPSEIFDDAKATKKEKKLKEEGMDTEWMRIFDGKLVTKRQIKRASEGSRWSMVYEPEDSAEATRVILEKTKTSYKVYREDMSLLHMFGKEQFYELLDDGIFESANEGNYDEAKQSVRDRLEMSVRHDNVRLAVSPKRALLRAEAFDGMRRQAAKMIKYTSKKHPAAGVGDCVKLPLKWMDKSRLDGSYLVGVVIRVTVGGRLQVACKAGVIDHCFCRSHLTRLDGVSNNRKLHFLDTVYQAYQGMPRVSLRHAARWVSQTGGQGVKRCSCKGRCDKMRCTCRKNAVKCGNHCKCSAAKCCNRES